MLKQRDRDIIQALHLFRCLSRDQLSTLFFSTLKNPITSTNFVLKRMRREGHIIANESNTPYIYFPNPPIIKVTSQKVKHYLAIADFYISVCRYLKPSVFRVEPRFGTDFMQPDIFMILNNTPVFVEIQNSVYSARVMAEKFNRYLYYYQSKEWIKEEWYLNQEPHFPFIWIVSKKINYPLSFENLNIIQTRNVESFLDKYLVTYL
ncbi:replication-relaxation family protein [Neobacillus cucumis]|uniref:replication-relaxation family protein n=1 Tax=Neobacillus cucumis TaxID=1740721 RepID=UPI001963BEA1|nr:replication-relaxation family protein [Neobacillus cucumis]MBM7655873.1 hypothetical protein [Neobacillus cucumis]